MQIRSMESSFVWLHRLADLTLPPFILFLLTTAYELHWVALYQNVGILSGLLLLLVNQYSNLYQGWRGRSLFEGAQILLKSWLIVWAMLIILAFATKLTGQYSRLVLSIWCIATYFFLISYRYVIRIILSKLYKTGHFIKTAAIYGSGDVCDRLQTIFTQNPWLGYKISGVYDDYPVENPLTKLKGGSEELLLAAKSGSLQIIYIAMPASREEDIKNLLNKLSDSTVAVKYVPDFFSYGLLHASMTNIGGLPVVNLYDSPLNDPGKALLKRLEDIILSLIILVFISPVLLVISIGIKITSRGPIIFKQKRYGLKGDEITVYKFRTMTTQDNGSVVKQATRDDPRITRFGSFLRKTSLDELPQFINSLIGTMSIVGPRPHAIAHNEMYRNLIPKYMQRHLVKPGITGWAQINGWRGETDKLEKMEKRIEYDLYYINNWSPWFDLKIIILTVFKGLINKNAY